MYKLYIWKTAPDIRYTQFYSGSAAIELGGSIVVAFVFYSGSAATFVSSSSSIVVAPLHL